MNKKNAENQYTEKDGQLQQYLNIGDKNTETVFFSTRVENIKTDNRIRQEYQISGMLIAHVIVKNWY